MGTLSSSVMALTAILNFFYPLSLAFDADCDFEQFISPGQQFYIHNKEYPDLFTPPVSCRWSARSPPNSKIILSCEDIDLQQSSGCQTEFLMVSLTGNPSLQDGRRYCGQGQLSLVSDQNQMTIGLYAPNNAGKGKFLCSITSIESGPTTTTEKPTACDCGWKNGLKIVGGHETGVNEFPSMAALVNFVTRGINCGASIISNRYAVTAAHCLEKYSVGEYALLVGDHNITSGNDTPYSALYTIIQHIVHENFNRGTMLYDIGLVKTEDPIQFSPYVGPACLPFKYTSTNFIDKTVTALGWGTIAYTDQQSDTLQEVDLNIIRNTDCQIMNADHIIEDSQICTYADGKDACQYDSGGPLLWMDYNTHRLQLLGIISYGKGCATGYPSVNTRVTSYLVWIVTHSTDANYCIR